MHPLPLLLDVPPAFAPKARYALEELLRPLGLASVEQEEGAALYYGPHPERSGARLALRCADDTPGLFDAPRPLAPEAAGWMGWDGERWPVPVRSGDPRQFDGADVVASAFWWLSGWQEAATRQRDVHGRFPYAASWQAALGTAHLPAVDAYRCALAEALEAVGVPLRREPWGRGGERWAVLLSHDVDRVRRRRLGTLVRGVLQGDPVKAVRRALALGNADLHGLDALLVEAERRGGRATLFAKAGRTGRLDAPYRLSREVRSAFRDAAERGHEIALHPSTFAMRHPDHLASERDRLARAVGALAPIVRAHYLRVDPALSPAELEAAGFRADASLGFSAAVGYRRGTGRPFRLWDLQRGRPSMLWEVPLVVMDTTLLQHLGMDAQGAAEETARVLDGARRTGGCASILWHNRPLDEPVGREALATYRTVLDAAQAHGAALLPIGAALGGTGGSGRH